MSRFDWLCNDFNRRQPHEIDYENRFPLFEAEWTDGRRSLVDLLVRFLKENKYEYLHSLGQTWVLYFGEWCLADFDVCANHVRCYLLKGADDNEKNQTA